MSVDIEFHSPEHKVATGIWFTVLATAWLFLAYELGSVEFSQAESQWEQRDLGQRVQDFLPFTDTGRTDPSRIAFKWLFFGLGGAAIAVLPAYLLGYVCATRHRAKKLRQIQVINDREAETAKHEAAQIVEARAAAEEREASLCRTSELIKALGSIDQYLRVLEAEGDATRRVVALQSIQGILTSVNAKLAAGQFTDSDIRNPAVASSARQTCREASKIGLRSDRIFGDLVRTFRLRLKLPQPPAESVENETSRGLAPPPASGEGTEFPP